MIVSSQGESQESYVQAADFSGELIQITSRTQEFTQNIDHAHGNFYILANDTHKNGRLVKVSDKNLLLKTGKPFKQARMKFTF